MVRPSTVSSAVELIVEMESRLDALVLQPGDVIEVAHRSRGKAPFVVAAAGAHAPERLAPYLEVSLPGLTARLTRLPLRSEVPVVRDEQLVVEYYSR